MLWESIAENKNTNFDYLSIFTLLLLNAFKFDNHNNLFFSKQRKRNNQLKNVNLIISFCKSLLIIK